MYVFQAVFAGLLNRSGTEAAMNDELSFHIETRTEDLIRSGCSPEVARRSARLEFGTVEGYKEKCRTARGFGWIDEMRGNLRFALRTMWKKPNTTIVALLSLALGIGVNISSFTSVNSLVLHPFPYPDLKRIVTVWGSVLQHSSDQEAVAPADFTDWRTASRSFDELAAYRNWDVALTGAGDPERVQASLVSPEFFQILNLKPELGRSFTKEEGKASGEIPIVISHGFWKAKLPSLADPVGKSILLGQQPYMIVGVMPKEFDFPLACELWAPLRLSAKEKSSRTDQNLMVIGKLKPDVSIIQAQDEMRSVAKQLEREYWKTNQARTVLITPLASLTSHETGRFTVVLMGATIFVLLLACTNVSNLHLARISSQRKEFSLRAALGANRMRLVRQVITEGIVVGVLGGGLGLLLACWNLGITQASIPSQVLHWVAGLKNMQIDGLTIVFAVSISILAGAFCCLPAVIQLWREEAGATLAEDLKEGGRASIGTSSGNRLRNALIVVEVALALLLVVGAGLMVGTFKRLMSINPGFDPKNVLTADLSLSPTSYRDPAQITGFFDQVLAKLDTVQAIRAVGISADLGTPEKVILQERGAARPDEPRPAVSAISSRYLDALRLPVLQGRGISDQDVQGRPRVVVVSQSFANHYWKTGNVIGRKIQLQTSGDQDNDTRASDDSWLTIVGVCKDTRNWFFGTPIAAAYVSYKQSPQRAIRLSVKTTGNPIQASASLRTQIKSVNRMQALYNIKTLEDVLSEESSGVRISARMMTTYAAIAFLLALTGIYSITSFFVAQRTQEIGVRMALGATPSKILRMTIGQSGRMALAGLVIGLCLSIALTSIMSHALYNIVSMDLVTIFGLTLALALAALLAGFIPAQRAARIDPIVALRR